MEPVREGEVLAGKYRIERVLGRGGMGVVVAAEHMQLAQRVALKFLLPDACKNGEAVARFLREARAAVRIQSEHVARVTDVGQLENGAPYMVMEFLHGGDLGAVLHERGPLPVAEAVDYVLQASEAVAEAHAIGIVHRDLKPANLFLTRRRDGSPLVKVLDFGISKATQGEAGLSLTSTSAVMGSPLYMSPEQVRSAKDVDARADIWAIGVILQELLVGAPPFSAETASALFATIIADAPISPRSKRPDLPLQLEFVLGKCLEKDRTRRYQNIAELASALAPFGHATSAASVVRISRVLGVSGTTMPSHQAAPAAEGVTADRRVEATAGAWGSTQSAQGTRRTGIYVGLTLAAFAVVGGGLAFLFTGRTPVDESASSASAPSAAVAPVVTPAVPPPSPSIPEPTITPATAAPPPPSASVTPVEAAAPVAPARPPSKPPARPPAAPTTKAPARTTPATAAPPPAPAPAPRRQKDLFDDTQ